MEPKKMSNQNPAQKPWSHHAAAKILFFFGGAFMYFSRLIYEAENEHYVARKAQIEAGDRQLAEFNKALLKGPIPIHNKAQPGRQKIEPPSHYPAWGFGLGGITCLVVGLTLFTRK